MQSLFWLGLCAVLVALLALDLGVFHRRPRAQTATEALSWSLLWIGTALAFNVFVYFAYQNHWLGIGTQIGHAMDGQQAALQFLTAFLVEKSLSLDNVFVIAMVFSYFAVPLALQYRVLFWGVVGALVMRAVFIVAGLALVQAFAWTTYVFGGLLLFTAGKLLMEREEVHPENNGLVRLLERHVPVCQEVDGSAFFLKRGGRWMATRLFLVLLVVETTDLLFAVDSIPAVIAVTNDPFIAFSSNAFAILGLRSLYFVIAPLIARFRYLKLSLIVLLAFIGVKMLVAHVQPIPISVSLSVIVAILSTGIAASALASYRERTALPPPVAAELSRLMRISVRTARRLAVGAVGATALAVGVALLVLPGPGLLVLGAGLAILSSEFVFARRWLRRLRELAAQQVGRPAQPPPARPPREADGRASAQRAQPISSESRS
jgi:tellurite resistance protein TerC